MARPSPYRICFLCSGNICRSPMAEIVARTMVEGTDIAGYVEFDSAGTGDWHVGESADHRTRAALRTRGYDGESHRAQWFDPAWLHHRDLILVADHGHLRTMRRIAGGSPTPHVQLLRSYDHEAVTAGSLEIHDPYYGDARDFDRCLDEVERACRGLVASLTEDLIPTRADV